MSHYRTRILIVDDDALFTKRLKISLELSGEFEVRTENISRHTFHAIREFHPDLIILDEDMPEMQGGMVAEHLRDDPRFNTPIIFLTALIIPKEEARSPAGDRLVAKPVDIEKLIRIIREELVRASRNAAAAENTQTHPAVANPGRPSEWSDDA